MNTQEQPTENLNSEKKSLEILTYRPEGMTFKEYKFAMSIQRAAFRKVLRGRCPSKRVAMMMPLRFGYNAHAL